MKVAAAASPAITMAKIGVAIQKKSQDQAKLEGAAAVELIQKAGENMPLTEGHMGRTINVAT
jgi:hypothetical protein